MTKTRRNLHRKGKGKGGEAERGKVLPSDIGKPLAGSGRGKRGERKKGSQDT